MNLLAILSLMILPGCAGSDKASAPAAIEPTKLKVLDGSVQVVAWGVGTDTLRIQAQGPGQTWTDSSMLLDLPPAAMAPVQTATGYQLGSFEIRPTLTGYDLYSGGTFMYNSAFTATGSQLTEVRTSGQDTFMGMGDPDSSLLKDGTAYSIYNYPSYGEQTHLYVPFICSSTGKGFYYNAASNDTVTFGKRGSGTFTFGTATGSIDSYYYQTAGPKEAIAKFYALSGASALLPKWAYGFIQSKYGYHTNAEVQGIVDTFGTRGLPLSAIVLDLYWFKTMGDLDWDLGHWDPAALHTYLAGKNVKLITITEPYILTGSTSFTPFSGQHALAEDSTGKTVTGSMWAGTAGLMNPLAPTAMTTIGAAYQKLLAGGVDGFWTDLGEPEKDLPAALFGTWSMTGFHNYYNREWSHLIFNAVSQASPDHRIFQLSRSGFTGSGGYGVSHWSGDVAATWLSLANQIGLGLNDGMAGFAFWGSDTGGFDGEPDGELFTRWYQFSAFVPVFRAHSANPREPWAFDTTSSHTYYTPVVNYLKQRFKFQPYTYSTARQTFSAGIPMMRALNVEFPADATLYAANAGYLGTEYMFGDALLVAPVTQAGITTKTVYLPGTSWYRLSDFAPFQAGLQTVPITLADIPVFVRAGAIIPWSEAMTGEADTLYLFPTTTTTTSMVWYDDDGLTNQFKTGTYEAITVTLSATGVTFDGVKTPRNLTLNILTNPAGAAFSDKFTTRTISLAAGSSMVTF